MIKEVNYWEYDPLDNGCKVLLTDAQITSLSIWLVLAYNDPNVKPLWFASHGEFAARADDVVTLKGIDGVMSMDAVNKSLYEINSTVGGPLANEYNREGLYTVKVIDGILGYFDGRDISCSSIALRYSEDLGVWYGIKGTNVPSTHSIFLNYDFDNLTLGQF